MNGFEVEMDEETFKSLKPADQNWIIMRTVVGHQIPCQQRFDKIEKKQNVATGLTALAAMVGGALAGWGGHWKRLFGGE